VKQEQEEALRAIGAQIRSLREQKGLTQEERMVPLADKLYDEYLEELRREGLLKKD
jgi:transcriptional regulator with XRE-family HTH domain